MRAHPCSQNQGVARDPNKRKTKFNPFVDDLLMAELRKYILVAMAASIEALFIVMGPLDEEKRRSPLSIEKFLKATCSYEKEQFGLIINTRTIMVSFATEEGT